MSRIGIPGGSGFLGQALSARLVGRGDEVVILSRNQGQPVPGARTVVWDAESIGPWASELDGADAIVHLTGRRAMWSEDVALPSLRAEMWLIRIYSES
jgi:uncharacterized protein